MTARADPGIRAFEVLVDVGELDADAVLREDAVAELRADLPGLAVVAVDVVVEIDPVVTGGDPPLELPGQLVDELDADGRCGSTDPGSGRVPLP